VSQDPAERVRVTGPTRRRTAATRSREIDAGTRVGAIYMGSLLREQLRLALRVIATLFATVGSLPLLFYLAPGLSGVRVLGLPLAWLLLGVLVHPFLLLLGWRYIRRAEDNERDFTDLVQEMDR
jgi:hypothetical protein